jgi:hypothetical protein
MAFTTIAVTGTYLQADNSTAATGNVSFIASTSMTDASNNQIVAPTLVTATLNGSGSFSLNLTATNDTTTSPSGVTYEVTENIDLAGQNKYNIEIAFNSPGSTLDLADITPTVTPITSYSYATQAYVATAISAQTAYTHDQMSPSTTWSVTHNLGFKPSVFVVDTSDNVCFGDVAYTNANALTITFAQSFGGKAYLS